MADDRRPPGEAAGQGRAAAGRRRALRALGALAAGPLAAACAPFWGGPPPGAGQASRPDSLPRPVATPAPGGARALPGRARLRLVVTGEGAPGLDAAVREVIADAARVAGLVPEVQDAGVVLGTGAGAPAGAGGTGSRADPTAGGRLPDAEAVVHRLLAAVQAGVPPDGVLLLGRQAQVARLRALDLVQDVSGLMRRTVARLGPAPRTSEALHVVAGNWFAVPWYQRLIGHWVRGAVARAEGVGPQETLDYPTLRRALAQGAGPAGPPLWGIGGADTPDVDAWCWGAIHAWGGGLADLKGERVALDTPETVAALQWLAGALDDLSWRASVPPDAGRWADGTKNARFAAAETAYTYTEQALVWATPGGAAPAGGPGGGLPDDVLYLRTLGGPAARPRAVGGGACWLLPRGAPAEPVERLLEALLEPAVQRRLWGAGEGFALPAYASGWDDPAISGTPWSGQARRFWDELRRGGFVSATGNGGPETAASQAVGALRFGAGMLRAVLAGRPAGEVVAETQGRAVELYRTFGLPGA